MRVQDMNRANSLNKRLRLLEDLIANQETYSVGKPVIIAKKGLEADLIRDSLRKIAVFVRGELVKIDVEPEDFEANKTFTVCNECKGRGVFIEEDVF